MCTRFPLAAAGITRGALGCYTFMTGVSWSSELCGRMVLLLEWSFSRFCRKPLLFSPSRMTVLLDVRLMRVLWRHEGHVWLICVYKHAAGPMRWYFYPPRGSTASSMSNGVFSSFDYNART